MNEELLNLFRTKPGFAGDTSRVLTEYYFKSCYDKGDLIKSALLLLNFRNSLYRQLSGINEISESNVKLISENFLDNIPVILMILFYLENSAPQIKEVVDTYFLDIYKVIIIEHKTIANSMGFTPIVQDLSNSKAELLSNLMKNIT